MVIFVRRMSSVRRVHVAVLEGETMQCSEESLSLKQFCRFDNFAPAGLCQRMQLSPRDNFLFIFRQTKDHETSCKSRITERCFVSVSAGQQLYHSRAVTTFAGLSCLPKKLSDAEARLFLFNAIRKEV